MTEGQSCAEGLTMLKQQTEVLHDVELEQNPFQPTDSDIEEANVSFNLIDGDNKENDFIFLLCIELSEKYVARPEKTHFSINAQSLINAPLY